MRSPWIAAIALLAFLPPLHGAPSLLRDFNQGPAGFRGEVYVSGITDSHGVRYFVASDPAHGHELWRTDGTPAGTWRMTDICPGPCDSGLGALHIFHDRLYFTANDGASGIELWSSPLEPNRAEPLLDLCPGACDSEFQNLEELGDRLYFIASAGPALILWQSDGTHAGTVPFFELCPRDCPMRSMPLQKVGGRLLFGRPLPDSYTLWATDGTRAGTQPFDQLLAGGPNPFVGEFVSGLQAGDRFWLINGQDLWVTDLTPAGTHWVAPLAGILPDLGERRPRLTRVIEHHGRLFARLDLGELLSSDGTREGTFLVHPQLDGEYELVGLPAGVLEVTPSAITRYGDSPGPGVPVGEPLSNGIEAIAGAGDRTYLLFFHLNDFDHPSTRELWVTDGTAAGTSRIHRAPEQIVSYTLLPSRAGEPTYFVEGDGYSGGILWRTEGTELSTWPLRDFSDVPASGGPLSQARLDGRLLFSAQTSLTAAPLFTTDGTPAGTREVGAAVHWARDFHRLGGQILFGTANFTAPAYGAIWRTDGTAAGTVPLAGQGQIGAAIVAGRRLIYTDARSFGYYHSEPETELFGSDGTRAGTGLVRDINPYLVNSGPHHLCAREGSYPVLGAAIGSRVVFGADDGWTGRELWITDGTTEGTRLLRDLDPRRTPGPPPRCDDLPDGRRDSGRSSDPQQFLAYKGGALFTADDGRTGRELWWTDGTALGTHRVRDLASGAAGSSPHDLAVFQGKVYFVAATTAQGEALWRTDGTAAGTVKVADLALAGSPSWASHLTAAGDHLFFTVYNEKTGTELWVSDGDTASTHLLADLAPGPRGSAPQALTNVQGILFFAADDGETGLEPWRSDGTAAGTRRLGDLYPGAGASSPGPFDRVGGFLVTGADDGTHGREPWSIPLVEVLAP